MEPPFVTRFNFFGDRVKRTEGGRRWRDKCSDMNERIMCVVARVPVCAHACSCTRSGLCNQPLRYAGSVGIGSAAHCVSGNVNSEIGGQKADVTEETEQSALCKK